MSSLNGASDQRALGGEVLGATKLAKSYGGHLVLKHVDFSIGEGEIVAVIGENGAGKSTFAKIVAGAVQPESGELTFRSRHVEFRSPRDALRAGIAYIPQELAYLPDVSVAEMPNVRSSMRTHVTMRWPPPKPVASASTCQSANEWRASLSPNASLLRSSKR